VLEAHRERMVSSRARGVEMFMHHPPSDDDWRSFRKSSLIMVFPRKCNSNWHAFLNRTAMQTRLVKSGSDHIGRVIETHI